MFILGAILLLFRSLFRDHTDLALKNPGLRQQLKILRREAKRPRLRMVDRAFWVTFSQTWKEWRSTLTVARPKTVLWWHPQGFQYF